jgi:hypothetical protein
VRASTARWISGHARAMESRPAAMRPLAPALLPTPVQVGPDRDVGGAQLLDGERVHQDVHRLEGVLRHPVGLFLMRAIGDVDGDHEVGAEVARRRDRYGFHERAVHEPLAPAQDRQVEHRHGARGADGVHRVPACEQAALAVGHVGGDGAEAPRP